MINLIKMDKIINAIGWDYNEYEESLIYKENEGEVKGVVPLGDVPHLFWEPNEGYLYIRVIGDTAEEVVEEFESEIDEIIDFLKESEAIVKKIQAEAERKLNKLEKGE